MTATTAGVAAGSSGARRGEGALLLAIAAVTTIVFAVDLQSPARTLLALAFMLVCPGLPFVRLAGVRDPILVAVLAVALSAAVDTLVAEALIYAHVWSPGLGVVALGAICVSGLGLDRRRSLWSDLRPNRPVPEPKGLSAIGTVTTFDTLAEACAYAREMRKNRSPPTQETVPVGRPPDIPLDGLSEAISSVLREVQASARAIREQADLEAAAIVAAARLQAATILRQASEAARQDPPGVRSGLEQTQSAEALVAQVPEDPARPQPLLPTPDGD